MKLHRSIASAVLAALLFVPAGGYAQVADPIVSSQLQNLGQLEDAIKAYYSNGSYDAEVTPIENAATSYIDKRVAAGVKKPALVLDIDDTALLTFGYEKKYGFGFTPDTWNAYAQNPGFPAVAQTLALARHAQSAGVAVFFITGRRAPLAALTAKNLAVAGYTYVHLYLRPASDHRSSVIPFKSSMRAAIERSGYTVLETVGDQWSDLEGGHAERAYKLPNPMYYIP
jgi:predicted secreted acid phosphatase